MRNGAGARGTALRQIQLDLTNRSLVNVGAGPNLLNRFDATLSFLFPESDKYQISFSYTVGRNDDTLERMTGRTERIDALEPETRDFMKRIDPMVNVTWCSANASSSE
jgi:hypothetical protein